MTTGSARPPARAQWLLRVLVPRRMHDELAGDLDELFAARAARDGVQAARRWYWQQVASAFFDAKPVRRPVIRRRVSGDPAMETLARDVRYALRMLAKQPAFTTISVLMLALGIGANATIFSWINSVLLNPLPSTTRVEEIVQLGYLYRGAPLPSFSYPDFRDIREQARTLSGVAIRDDFAAGIVIDKESERVWAEIVSGNFFEVLGVGAWRGRLLAPQDDVAGAVHAAVISYPYWVSRFGSDERAVGRAITINGQPFTIVGVAAPGFQGGESGLQFDLWLPVAVQPVIVPGGSRLEFRGSRWATVLGRMREGSTIEQVRSEVAAIVSGFAKQYQGYDAMVGTAFPLADSPTGAVSVLRQVLLILMTVAVIVLLIACANLAGLLLARASARQREMAIRLSVGAGRGRLVQQLLVEGGILAAAGTVAAIIALRWTTDLLNGFAPPSELPIHITVRIDNRVLLFTTAVALATVLLFALVPALQATVSDLTARLRDAGPGGPAFNRSRLRRGLVATQIALSMMLLAGAGLCVRSLLAAQAMTPGFSADGVVVGWMDLFSAGHTGATGRTFYTRVIDRVRAMPGVESVTLARRIPLGFIGGSFTNVTVDAAEATPDDARSVGVNYAGPDYMKTMRIALVEGRDIRDSDTSTQPAVAIVSETMARTLWPNGGAMGGRFMFGRPVPGKPPDWITVVGIARDVKQRSMTERPVPHAYLAALQWSLPSGVLHVRAAGSTAPVLADLPRVIRDIDPRVTFYNVGLLSDHTAAATFQQRMAANLLLVFGGLALLLAAIGSYGVLSYLVGQRSREIGIRLAVGATRASVFRLIAVSGARLVATGALAGLVLSAGIGFGMSSLLIGINPIDPVTFGSVLALMMLVAMTACLLPARRAAALDPMRTLREE